MSNERPGKCPHFPRRTFGSVPVVLARQFRGHRLIVARQRVLAVVRRAVGSLDDWQRSLRDIADGLGTLKTDTIELLGRSLLEVPEEDLAEAGDLEMSRAEALEPDFEDNAQPSPKRRRLIHLESEGLRRSGQEVLRHRERTGQGTKVDNSVVADVYTSATASEVPRPAMT